MTTAQLKIGETSYSINSKEKFDDHSLETYLKSLPLNPIGINGSVMRGLEFAVRFYTAEHNVKTLELTPQVEVASYRKRAEIRMGFDMDFSLKSEDFFPGKLDIETLLSVKDITERVRYIFYFEPISD